jgi:hypothetical protein
MRHPILWTLTGIAALAAGTLGVRRVVSDRHAAALEARLAQPAPARTFSESDLAGLPEPVQRYLRHAIAPGTPLSPSVRLWMDGTMTPTPGGPSTDLTAVETLAPHRGFVWTARATMNGLPVRVRDHYFGGEGGVDVVALGLVPIPLGGGPDVTRSSRGRLVAEAVWCPTALVHPSVAWEALGDDRARFTLTVDGDPISVTLRLGPDGALREVTLNRWGDVDGQPARPIPYGFRVEEERTFGGVTIPTRLAGGWHYGTDRFDPASAATFTVHRATFADQATP